VRKERKRKAAEDTAYENQYIAGDDKDDEGWK
jgi:hypothetical protein